MHVYKYIICHISYRFSSSIIVYPSIQPANDRADGSTYCYVVQVEVSVDWRLYDDMGHTVCWEELQDISDWIAERLKDDPEDGEG